MAKAAPPVPLETPVRRVILSQRDDSDRLISVGDSGQSFLVQLFHKNRRHKLRFDLVDGRKVIIKWIALGQRLTVEIRPSNSAR